MTEITVDRDQLRQHIDELGRIGLIPDKGLFRFQYEASWQEARDAILEWIRGAGLEARVDAVGNIYGRLEGRDARTILTGSHMDTVPSGGRYDGALGVLGGLAALSALRAHGRPEKSLEVVAFCEEESSRFHANFFGSRSLLGLVKPDEPENLQDRDGVRLATAMEEAGLDPDNISAAARDDLLAFIELHVEQGRVLEDSGVDIGLVDVIPGLAWESVTVRGRQDHAGATPMTGRKDALQAAAEIARRVTQLVERQGAPGVVTAGQWNVEPGWPSTVPGLARFSLDLRHPDAGMRDHLLKEVREICRDVSREREVEVEVARLKDEQPATMDAELLEVCRSSAEAAGASAVQMHSGAGHDSQVMATRVRTSMIFVPSVEGRSHRPDEFTSVDDCALGASVLAGALHKLAYQEGES